ncbi:transcriptional regulator GutM [Planococcus sp. N028]|uniref:Transcriptional regulator GutM n=1 Tax=Planococcus shixiaomingii TaxID=3058393 RepID=A0ABT8MZU4_9BACL|nr:transcriptional regulator GutM [Planococcus sp. N028]MDN7241168.1 transcriptional regulator GutM [Planococcus sp. N028]
MASVWGWVIAVFVGVWLLQFLLTKIQMKNYQETLRKLSSRPSGYLGVGIQKQKLGIGAIAILVTDTEGIVVESQVMKGVTVFSRFQAFDQFNGLSITELKDQLEDDSLDIAFKMAIEKVEAQMEKKTNLAF